jgi:Na+/H+ antiporter NhaC
MNFAIWLIPSACSLMAAIISKRIIPSIILGVSVGCYLKADGNILKALDLISYYISGAISDESNVTVVLFLFCFGALTEIIKLGGGISGFAELVQKIVRSKRGPYISVWLATPLTFLDCCFHAISTGIIAKTLQKNHPASIDRLSFIINVSSSQLIPLIPVATTYVAYILGILTPILMQHNSSMNPYTLYLQSIPYNFYSIIMVFFSILSTFFNFQYVPFLQPAYKKLTQQKGEHQTSEAEHQHVFEEKLPPRIINLLLPLLFLLSFVFYLIERSGMTHGATSLFQAMIRADYNQAILSATLTTIALTVLFFMLQKIPIKKIETAFFDGGTELLPPIIIIILAWSLTTLSQDLGLYDAMNTMSLNYFPLQLTPFLLFIISGITSYFIGSSWATWALLLPIAVSIGIHGNLPLIIGSVIAGGSIGDSISLLGEEPILVASIMEIPLTQHIRYVSPYGIAAALLSAIGYLFAGYIA